MDTSLYPKIVMICSFSCDGKATQRHCQSTAIQCIQWCGPVFFPDLICVDLFAFLWNYRASLTCMDWLQIISCTENEHMKLLYSESDHWSTQTDCSSPITISHILSGQLIQTEMSSCYKYNRCIKLIHTSKLTLQITSKSI